MRLWIKGTARFILFVLITSCSSSRVSTVGSVSSGFEEVTINDLSLNYRIHQTKDSINVLIHTDDRIMIARIMALGLTVSLKSSNSEFKSLNYPMGFFEMRKFRSAWELRRFWINTNTSAVWRSRWPRLLDITKLETTSGKSYYHVDSLQSGLSAQFMLQNGECSYRLVIPNHSSNSHHVDLDITVGKLTIRTKPLLTRNRDRIAFGIRDENYVQYFQSTWEVRVRN